MMTKKEEKKALKILKDRGVKEVYFANGKYYLSKEKAPNGCECIKGKETKPLKEKDNG